MSVKIDHDFLRAGMQQDKNDIFDGEVKRVEELLADTNSVIIQVEYPPLRDTIAELQRRGYRVSWKATGCSWHYTFQRN